MLRRIKRTRDFEISLQIKTDRFIAPPREAQRSWLVNNAMKEFTSDLMRLDRLARDFVPGRDGVVLQDRSMATLGDEEIMEDWQLPIMKAMAEFVTEGHGDILEVGFGRGISAGFIQDLGVRSHTIIECNDSIVDRFHEWKRDYENRDIRLVHARWQDALERLQTYDGIFFHTYPLNEDEVVEHVVNSTTFAEHFFETAAAHLRAGGVFVYMTNEIDSFSREHQRLLLRNFDSLTLRVVDGLKLPEDLADAWWANSMLVAKVVK